MKAGQTQRGTWSQYIDVPAKAHQLQAPAFISYPHLLAKEEAPTGVYRNEAQSREPVLPCGGSPSEPEAEPGFLCVYRGGVQGSLEAEDTNASFFNFVNPEGGFQSTPEAKEGARNGEIVLFRTSGADIFNEAAPVKEIAAPAYLSAFGGWAVTPIK
jgi:hypothetical protein